MLRMKYLINVFLSAVAADSKERIEANSEGELVLRVTKVYLICGLLLLIMSLPYTILMAMNANSIDELIVVFVYNARRIEYEVLGCVPVEDIVGNVGNRSTGKTKTALRGTGVAIDGIVGDIGGTVAGEAGTAMHRGGGIVDDQVVLNPGHPGVGTAGQAGAEIIGIVVPDDVMIHGNITGMTGRTADVEPGT